MPINVPVYTQKVGTASLPGVRQSGADPVSEAIGRVGQSISNLGGGAAGIVKKVTDEQDEAAVQDAYAKLSSAKQAYLDGPNGITTLKGKDALDEHESFVKAFNTDAADIRDKLTSDNQREKFSRILESEKLGFLDSVDRHVEQQSDVIKAQALDGARSAAQSDAIGAASRGQLDQIHNAIGNGLGAIDSAARAGGWDASYAEAQRKTFATQTHIGVLDTLLEKGDVSGAAFYLKEHSGEMDATMLSKSNMEKIIRTATDATSGAQMARKFVGGSASTVIRPWDPNTPIAHVDPTKALAELAKTEADPSVSETVKQAAREHTEALVRNSEQTYKAMLDDVYARSITKLSSNGWRLSALSQEKTFLLASEVGGGQTWQAIIDKRDQELHRQSGAASTPAQRSAMVQFLLTLPQRQTEYMTGDPNAFSSEWGPKLSGADMEQAAGYVARSGVAAAKPDETLPTPVIGRIKQAGAEAGFWDNKGPKTEDDQRRYLAVYTDLLAKQAELKRQGKPLDDKTVQDTMAAWATKGKVPGTGILWDDTASRVDYATDPKYQGKPFVEEIPDDFRKLAESKLKEKGQPASGDFVRWLYNKKLGVPDAQNPRPPDPRMPQPDESATPGYVDPRALR